MIIKTIFLLVNVFFLVQCRYATHSLGWNFWQKKIYISSIKPETATFSQFDNELTIKTYDELIEIESKIASDKTYRSYFVSIYDLFIYKLIFYLKF